MPGCRSYVIADDLSDADAIWITEVWETEAAHKASLTLPQVVSADGGRYAAGDIEFWIKGNSATLTRSGKSETCEVKPAAKAG